MGNYLACSNRNKYMIKSNKFNNIWTKNNMASSNRGKYLVTSNRDIYLATNNAVNMLPPKTNRITNQAKNDWLISGPKSHGNRFHEV